MAESKSAKASTAIILVSSDRGLCGSLNTNLLRSTEDFQQEMGKDKPQELINYDFIAVGRKAREYILKNGYTLYAEFTNLPERPSFEDILPISRIAVEGFLEERFKEIYLLYTAFITTLKQEVKVIRLLPVEAKDISPKPSDLSEPYKEYIFEPSPYKVLEKLLPHYVEIQTYQAILEAQASEHSARMVSMRNASDNATEIIGELSLIYNKQRQQSITNEILDLITSRSAVS